MAEIYTTYYPSPVGVMEIKGDDCRLFPDYKEGTIISHPHHFGRPDEIDDVVRSNIA